MKEKLSNCFYLGQEIWNKQAISRIHDYYELALSDFSIDMTHTLHYLLKMLDNMNRLNDEGPVGEEDADRAWNKTHS